MSAARKLVAPRTHTATLPDGRTYQWSDDDHARALARGEPACAAQWAYVRALAAMTGGEP